MNQINTKIPSNSLTRELWEQEVEVFLSLLVLQPEFDDYDDATEEWLVDSNREMWKEEHPLSTWTIDQAICNLTEEGKSVYMVEYLKD